MKYRPFRSGPRDHFQGVTVPFGGRRAVIAPALDQRIGRAVVPDDQAISPAELRSVQHVCTAANTASPGWMLVVSNGGDVPSRVTRTVGKRTIISTAMQAARGFLSGPVTRDGGNGAGGRAWAQFLGIISRDWPR
jgi:hypothetical protein